MSRRKMAKPMLRMPSRRRVVRCPGCPDCDLFEEEAAGLDPGKTLRTLESQHRWIEEWVPATHHWVVVGEMLPDGTIRGS